MFWITKALLLKAPAKAKMAAQRLLAHRPSHPIPPALGTPHQDNSESSRPLAPL